MNRFAAVLLVVLVLLSGCSGSAGSSSDPPSGTPGGSGGSSDGASPSQPEVGGIDHPTGSDAILVVTSEGGMLPVQMQVTDVPLFVLLGDGRVIVPGAIALIFPGPALPALQVRQLTEDGIQDVLEAIDSTELFAGDLDLRAAQNVVSDGSDTVFTLNRGDDQIRVAVFALGSLSDPMMGEPPPGVAAADIDADRVLRQLMDGLTAIDTSVGPDGWEAEGWQPYTPEALRLYVRDVTGQPIEGGEELPGQVVDWPTDADPAGFGEEVAQFGDGTRCGTVTGDEAATWLTALNDANQQTLWTTDGDDRWSAQARPLLPNEEVACP